ncbi:MAG: hypothetical protein MZV70_40315 [Desulfobacterales bacterium]|nr:hypothetical protein [Desulfobacterales bacterium]
MGVGSALVDILTREGDDFLDADRRRQGRHGLRGQGSHRAGRWRGPPARPRVVPGGSACNTVVGVGQLGGAARFVGKCGQGAMGEFFENCPACQQRSTPGSSRSSTADGTGAFHHHPGCRALHVHLPGGGRRNPAGRHRRGLVRRRGGRAHRGLPAVQPAT